MNTSNVAVHRVPLDEVRGFVAPHEPRRAGVLGGAGRADEGWATDALTNWMPNEVEARPSARSGAFA